MSAQKKWLAASVSAILIAGGAWIWLHSQGAGPVPTASPAADQAAAQAGTAAPAAAQRDRDQAGSANLPTAAAGAPTPALAPPAPRVMAYRPAKYLYYSSGSPAKTAAGDDDQPVLARIFEVTQADAAQRSQILAAWATHEDGRRGLWADSFPRRSGPRMLDPAKLGPLDAAFEAATLNILRPDQGQRLSQELPPPGESRTPPPEMYLDPTLEK